MSIPQNPERGPEKTLRVLYHCLEEWVALELIDYEDGLDIYAEVAQALYEDPNVSWE